MGLGERHRMAAKSQVAITKPGTTQPVENFIRVVRGRKVMLDRDLAGLYGVKAIALRQQVKRNVERFPSDFMFQLTPDEATLLVSQSRTSFGGVMPYVFSQEGIAMLSSVLRSPRAVTMNVDIMRALVRMCQPTGHNRDIAAPGRKARTRAGSFCIGHRNSGGRP